MNIFQRLRQWRAERVCMKAGKHTWGRPKMICEISDIPKGGNPWGKYCKVCGAVVSVKRRKRVINTVGAGAGHTSVCE